MTDKDTRDFYFNMGKLGVAGILLVGYYAVTILAMFFAIPTASAQLVASGFSVLGPVIGLVIGNMFPKGTVEDKKTIEDLTAKIPPTDPPVNPCKDCPNKAE